MAVPRRLRSVSDFKLLNDSQAFLTYLYRIDTEPKIVPKKHKSTIGKGMIDDTKQMIELISSANNVKVHYKSDYRRRRDFQERASAKLDTILCTAMSLDSIRKLNESTRSMLFNSIYEIGDLLDGWIVYDAPRYGNIK